MAETLNKSNNKEQEAQKTLLICACSEGEERSVAAAKLFKEHGRNSKVLPGGLEGLESYLTGQDDSGKMERLLNRGVSGAFSIRGNSQNSEYDRLLKRDAIWLLFIDSAIEAKKFEKVIKELQYKYGLEAIILNSWDTDSVNNEVNKFLKNN
jgi:hypothetical protein